jgi:hypothetical protein
MSAHSFPFQDGTPTVVLTLVPPDPMISHPSSSREVFPVDTGFSDYLQVDWDTFLALGLQHHSLGTFTSQLGDGSVITDLVSLVGGIIPECGMR